jgi:hypothetical protein
MMEITPEIETFIVRELALGAEIPDVSEKASILLGMVLPPATIGDYDPRKNRELSKSLTEEFYDVKGLLRPSALKSKKAYRLRNLQRMYDAAEASDNFTLQVRILELAAKESNDCFE